MRNSVLHRLLLTGALSLVPMAFTAVAFSESAAAAPPAAGHAGSQASPAHVVVDAHCQDAAHKAVDCAKVKCTDHAGKAVAACTAGHPAAAHQGAGAASSH